MPRDALLEELDLRVKKIKYSSDKTARTVFDAAVLEWRPRKKEWIETKQIVTCVGAFYGLVENDHIHVKAEEFEDRVYGPEYQIYVSNRIQPGTELEMKKFLMSIRGVGAKNADILISAFGLDVMSEILNDPSCLNPLGLSKSAKENLYKIVVENKEFEELLLFLQLHGIPPQCTIQIYKKYGNHSIDKIQDNPYSLYLDDVIDFPSADKLNQSLGGNTHLAYRLTAGLLACLREESDGSGNVFVSKDELPLLMRNYLMRSLSNYDSDFQIEDNEVNLAIETLVHDGYIIVDSTISSSPSIYLASNYRAECKVAVRLNTLMSTPKRFQAQAVEVGIALWKVQQELSITLASEQRHAVETAINSPISILTGGPGTGKTQTLNVLIQTLKKLQPDIDIRICAPTGKAAVRAEELTHMCASTIHRLIGYPQNLLDENELVCDFLIADEFSMCDIQLCSWLLNCIASGTRIVIVGDHEQLPSVGPGLVLRDMIDSECIPVTILQTVFRQSTDSRIILNAHAIINTAVDKPINFAYSSSKKGDFYFIEAPTQKKILDKIQKCTDRLLNEGFPLDQIEVLSPIHGGPIGVDNLNLKLQDLLNHGTHGYQTLKNIELKLGDKVIQTKNNYDLFVFNGETGIVKEINYTVANAVTIQFPNREVIYDAEQVNDLELAYAITTHRSQGSEFQVVIIPIHESILYNITRNILYTAITRAKARVILVGTEQALQIGLKKIGTMERHSNLILRLQNFFST